jgi:hypothetical protein
LKSQPENALIDPMPRRSTTKYEQLKFVAPSGSRDFYRSAATLAGMELKQWMRAVLHKEACRLHDKHGVDYDPPAVHPVPPPPLQPGTR